jgi:hypothetical protein
MNAHSTCRIFKALALGLAVAAVAAPLAEADPADRGIVPATPSGPASSDLRTFDPLVADAIRAEQASPELDPLISDAIRAEQASPDLDPLIADAIRAAEPGIVSPDDRSSSRLMPQPSVQPVVSINDGFEWTDAGVGAGSVLMLVLFGGGMTALAYRHRRRVATL